MRSRLYFYILDLFVQPTREGCESHAMCLVILSAVDEDGQLTTYKGKLRHHDHYQCQKVDDEICQIVVCVMCAQQKQNDWYRQ